MKKGPVPAVLWGRIWARALIDQGFRQTLESDIRQAVFTFVGDYVEPLFNENHRLACQCLRDFYDEVWKLERKDRPKLTRFSAGQINGPDPDIDSILVKTQPNTWTLTELASGAACTENNNIVAPIGPVLKQRDWARVYAEAILDYQGYGEDLKKNPTQAIDNFPGGLPRAVGDPILQLPTLAALRANVRLPAALQAPGALDVALDEIARGVCMEYEATLCICLTC